MSGSMDRPPEVSNAGAEGRRLRRWQAAWERIPCQRRSALATMLLLALLLALSWLIQPPPGGEVARGTDSQPAPASASTRPPAATGSQAPPATSHPPSAGAGAAPAPVAGAAPSPAGTGAAPGSLSGSNPSASPSGGAAAPGSTPAGAAGAEAAPPPVLSRPVAGTGKPERGFGWTYFPATGDWRLHTGLDLPGRPGTTVRAAAAGRVAAVQTDPLWGKGVTIDHGGGWQSRYWGLGEVRVQPGQAVGAGDPVGTLASQAAGVEAKDGPHLHFELRRDGRPVDPGEAFAAAGPAAGEAQPAAQ